MAWYGVARPRERRDTLRAGALDLRERHGKARRSRHGTGMARLTANMARLLVRRCAHHAIC